AIRSNWAGSLQGCTTEVSALSVGGYGTSVRCIRKRRSIRPFLWLGKYWKHFEERQYVEGTSMNKPSKIHNRIFIAGEGEPTYRIACNTLHAGQETVLLTNNQAQALAVIGRSIS